MCACVLKHWYYIFSCYYSKRSGILCRIGCHCSECINWKESAQEIQCSWLFTGKCCLTNLEVKSFELKKKKSFLCLAKIFSLKHKSKKIGFFFNLKKVYIKESFSSLFNQVYTWNYKETMFSWVAVGLVGRALWTWFFLCPGRLGWCSLRKVHQRLFFPQSFGGPERA